jgi:hypothetical protein
MLANVVLVDQLNEPTSDGLPDENATANCVDASLTGGIKGQYPDAVITMGGKTEKLTGDALKDAVYGQGYKGATDPARFMTFINQHPELGVTMAETEKGVLGTVVVAAAIAGLQRHHPVTAAIPSMWGNAWDGGTDMINFDSAHPNQGTHQIMFADWDGTNLTAMNPWHGFWQKQTRKWWEDRIVYGRCFELTPLEVHVSIIIVKDSAGNIVSAHDADNPAMKVGGGMAAMIDKNAWTKGSIAVPETYLSEGESVAVLRGAVKVAMTYSTTHGTVADGNGDMVQAVNDLYVAWQSSLADASKAQSDLAAAQIALNKSQADLA